MNKQIIISISREFGSGGHEIAREIAKHFNLPLYDKNILYEIAKKNNANFEELEKYDEVPKNRLFSRSVSGHTSSPAEAVANMQFDFIKERAQSGESFVVVGRCSNSLLSDYDELVSIFVTADMDKKIERVAEFEKVSSDEAEAMIQKFNKKRKAYHNFYCRDKWGDSRFYELTVNTSKIGIPNAYQVIENYVNYRINN